MLTTRAKSQSYSSNQNDRLYLLCWSDDWLNSDDIADWNTFRHEALRHNQLKWHLTGVWDFYMCCWFDLLHLLLILDPDPNLRLLATSHYLQHLFWLCLRQYLFNLDNKVVLPWQLQVAGLITILLIKVRWLFVHDKFADFIQGHVQGRLIVELICEVILEPLSVASHCLLVHLS